MFCFGRSYKTYYEEQAERAYGNDSFADTYIHEIINNSDKYYTVRTDIKFEYPDLPAFTTYPEWRKGISNNMLQFVVGDKDPANDAVWQDYIKECNSYGIQTLMDEAAARYFK
jgi:hypothetical protein